MAQIMEANGCDAKESKTPYYSRTPKVQNKKNKKKSKNKNKTKKTNTNKRKKKSLKYNTNP